MNRKPRVPRLMESEMRPTTLPRRGNWPSLLAMFLAMLLLSPALTASVAAQDGETPPTDESPTIDETAAPVPAAVEPAKPVKPLRIPVHSHRISVFGGIQRGETIREQDLIAPPLNFELQHLIIDMDDSTAFGARYSYQLYERWGVEVSLTRASTEAVNRVPFDRAYAEFIAELSRINVPVVEAALVQRLDDHSGPYDLDVTYLDVGAVRIFNPRDRWVAEADFGLGWAHASLGTDPAVFEQLAHSSLGTPAAPLEPVIANEVVDPTGGLDCPSDNDPCVALRASGGLSWHAGAALSAVLTKHVHLRMGVRYRFVNHVTDPGDSYLTPEASLGLSFILGGD